MHPSTKLIQFLNDAFKTPPHVIAGLLERFDDVETRNLANLDILMRFAIIEKEKINIDSLSPEEFQTLTAQYTNTPEKTQKWLEFTLAMAVMRKFQ